MVEEQQPDEVPTPHEHKTFEREPLHTVIYAQTKEGKAISYHRIYKKTYKQIGIVKDAIKDHYGYGGEGYEGKHKLHLKTLSDLTEIDKGVLKTLLIMMASCKRVIRKEGDKWKVEQDKPYLILQQKAKHIDRNYFGRKTPVFILPFEEKYYLERKE